MIKKIIIKKVGLWQQQPGTTSVCCWREKKRTLVCLQSHILTRYLDLRHSFGAIYHDKKKSYMIGLNEESTSVAFRKALQMQSRVKKIQAQKGRLTAM